MKIRDMLKMSLSSLWKRKVRTILTILGVVIGTISVVVMISLGIGMKQSMLDQMESYGSLKLITVREKMYGGSEEANEDNHINDDVVQGFSQLEHVETVVPVLEVTSILKTGRYESWSTLRGVSPEGFEKMGIDVGEGSLPKNPNQLELFYGNVCLINFYDAKTGTSDYYELGTIPDIDLMNDMIFLTFEANDYSDESGGDVVTSQQPAKKHIVKTSGIMAGAVDDWTDNSFYTFCNIDALKSLLKKEFKGKTIPGQPVRSNGKPYKDIFYTEVLVYCDDMENVMDVQKILNDMGYETMASAEWIESEMKSINSTQTIFGCIGVVSLIVAAIGIVNTMMMSIYERTKEIGVMKVIGCTLGNIQALFLLEAAYIGFIGGVIGIGLSFPISKLVNKAFAGDEMGLITASVIPPWLVIVSIVFATIVGMLSGLLPSFRAMKLSPLEAMRT